MYGASGLSGLAVRTVMDTTAGWTQRADGRMGIDSRAQGSAPKIIPGFFSPNKNPNTSIPRRGRPPADVLCFFSRGRPDRHVLCFFFAGSPERLTCYDLFFVGQQRGKQPARFQVQLPSRQPRLAGWLAGWLTVVAGWLWWPAGWLADVLGFFSPAAKTKS